MSRRKTIKINFLKPAFWVVIFVMLAGNIFMTIDVATSGSEISSLENQVASLNLRNRELNAQVIKYSSVAGVDGESQGLGFDKPEKTVYLTPDHGFFAKLP